MIPKTFNNLIRPSFYLIVFTSINIYLIVESTPETRAFNTNTYLSLFNISILTFNLIKELTQINYRPLNLHFWIFEYIFFGLTPFAASVDLNPYYVFRLATESTMTKALIILILIHIGLTFTSFRRSPSLEIMRFSLDLKRINFLIIFYLLSLPVILNLLGGREFFIRNSRYSQYSQIERTPILIIIEAILRVIPIVIFLFISFSSYEQKRKLKIQRKITLIICLVLSNPIVFARQTSMLMLVPIISVYCMNNPKLRISYPFALMGISLFFANPFDRYDGKLKKLAFVSPSRSGDFDAFGQFMNAIEVYDKHLVNIFSQLGGPLGFFIPREIWSSKPLDSGVLIAKLNNFEFQNLSCPWLGEAYINFGLIGCVLAGLFAWLLLRNVYSRNKIELISNIYLASTSFIVLRGSLLQATGNLVSGYVLIRICRKLLVLDRMKEL